MTNAQYYYSYTGKGFYWLSADELNDENFPDDLMVISEDAHSALFEGQANGKYISHTPSGPLLVEQPEYTPEEWIALNENKKTRLMQTANMAIAPLQDAVDMDMATDDETVRLQEWKKYRVLLSRVDSSAPDWPLSPA